MYVHNAVKEKIVYIAKHAQQTMFGDSHCMCFESSTSLSANVSDVYILFDINFDFKRDKLMTAAVHSIFLLHACTIDILSVLMISAREPLSTFTLLVLGTVSWSFFTEYNLESARICTACSVHNDDSSDWSCFEVYKI